MTAPTATDRRQIVVTRQELRLRASGCFFKRAYVQGVKLWLDWNREATSEIHKTSEWKQFMGFFVVFFVLGDSKVQFGFRDASQETKCSQSERRGLTQV